jgi:hypothetical protein
MVRGILGPCVLVCLGFFQSSRKPLGNLLEDAFGSESVRWTDTIAQRLRDGRLCIQRRDGCHEDPSSGRSCSTTRLIIITARLSAQPTQQHDEQHRQEDGGCRIQEGRSRIGSHHTAADPGAL